VHSSSLECKRSRLITWREYRALPKYMSSHTFGVVIENLQAHVLPEFFDRDSAREAVIGVIEADDLGDQTLDERRSHGEDGLQNRLLPLEGRDIARIDRYSA
jgi:hypothetical protein